MVAAPLQESLEAVAAAGPHALLASLPPEIIQNVFSWLNPDDLEPVSRVCRLFRDFIKENQTLCRDIYLLHLVSLRALMLCAESHQRCPMSGFAT
jgi:hypothetical protein